MTFASSPSQAYEVIIIGAGAAGLFCAWQAAERGLRILVLDHAKKIGEKIRISGGGRCNFTNLYSEPKNFLSANPKFAISALRRFPPQAFVDLVDQAGIAWHEKTLGQLFCDDSAQQIIDMLVHGCRRSGAKIDHPVAVQSVTRATPGFHLETDNGPVSCRNLVIATGGLSIPKIGATGFGYDIAKQFGLPVIEPRPGLVPLTFSGDRLKSFKALSGVATPVRVSFGKARFDEALLFTHRGLSGPAVLQISSYWQESAAIIIDLLPGQDALALLKDAKVSRAKAKLKTLLSEHLPQRLAEQLAEEFDPATKNLADFSDKVLAKIAEGLNRWQVLPAGSEGYRTAEVTLGGVDTKALSSQTMEAKTVPGLYFIGEVMDVTGHLGGHNFQWAWASGHVCARALSKAPQATMSEKP